MNGINSYSGSATITAAAPHKPEVVAWVDSLGCATERLAELVTTLDGRLSTALSNADETDAPELHEKASCQLAGSIHSRVLQLNRIEDALRSILRRLEI